MANATGMVFVIRKHLHRESGKMKRRNMFSEAEMDKAAALAERYAEQNGEDFLIVQVVAEVSKPSKKAASKGVMQG